MEAAAIRLTFRAASSLSARRQLASSSICSRCLLHTTAAKEATPIAHPTVPGPPPNAPQADPSFSQSRIARKKQLAATLHKSQNVKPNPSKPGSALSKRFWKNVSVKEVDEGLQILLDTRPVRTATRQVLVLPKSKRALAASIAMEWDQLISAQQALKQHYIPLTSLVSRAIDIEAADQQGNSTIRDSIVKTATRYLSTDTLLCWAPEKSIHDPLERPAKSLRERQREVAEPIIGFLTTHVFPGVEIVEILSEDSIIPRSQPQMTTEVIRGWVSGLPPFELAALERGILATKSLLVAVRVLVEWSQEWKHLQKGPGMDTGRFGIEEAAEAATLEVLYQTEQWGEVEDTHDVEKEDLRRQLGSSILLVS